MTPIVAFILGLLIGWLVEWIIDWLYWRPRYQGLQDSAAQCQQKLASLDADLLSSKKEVQSLQEKVSQLELEKATLETRSMQIQQELDTSHAQPAIPQPIIPDNLEEIKGIGPVIAKLLNKNGIYTFEQLAAQTPEFLRKILGDLIQRLANEESLIEQARQFAQRKLSKGASGQ
jgi:predicted flap endonuclease-1-like 5' DNA nuclease